MAKTPFFDHGHKDLADILKGALTSLAGFLGRTGARVIFLFFAGNFYGATRLGELAAVIAVTEILVMIGIFGFRRSLMELLQSKTAKNNGPYGLIKTALTVSFLVALGVAVALALLWDLVGLIHRTGLYPLFAFIIPFIALMDVFLTTTRFKRIIRYEVFARSLVEPWTLALSAVTFYLLGWELFGLLLAYVTSLLAAFLFALWAFGREYSWKKLIKAKVDLSFAGKMGTFSGPTAIVDAIGVAFRRVDIIFLGLFTPDAVVGIYYGVQNVATVLQKTRHVFDPILSPVISQTLSRKGTGQAGRQLAQVCRWILTLLAFQLALMAFYAGPLLSLIGEGFAAGALALVIILAAEAIEGSFASAELPFVFKKPRLNLLLTGIGFGGHVVGCFVLVQIFGMVGAALSFLISVILLNGMRLVAIRKIFDIALLRLSYLKPIAAGTLAYLSLYYLNMVVNLKAVYFVPLGIGVGIGVYVAVFWLLKPTQEDRDFVAYLRSKKKPAKLVPDKDFDQV